MYKERKKLSRFLKYAILFIIIIGILIAFSNLNKLKKNLISMNFKFLAIAIISAFIIYVLEGFFLKICLRVFDEKLPIFTSIKYSFIINSLGYLVSLGGLTPFAIQAFILGYHNINGKKSTLSRALQVILFNLVFIIILIVGFLYTLFGKIRHQVSFGNILLALIVFFTLVIVFYLILFWRYFRTLFLKRAFTIINKIIVFFKKKSKSLDVDKVLVYFNEFNESLNKLKYKPLYIFIMISIAVIDWAIWLSIMYLSFLTMNYKIHLGVLITGYSVGQIVGFISMSPGGIGTMEGSMSLIFRAFGIPLETALVASLLYRLSFYIIPFIFSLPFYFSLKQRLLK